MKNIFTYIVALLFVVSIQPALSQSKNTDATIMGHVVDATTGEHLPYITIALKGTTIGTVTDGSGHYFLKNLPAGDFTIVASSIGYTTIEKKVKIVPHKNQEVNFQLAEQAMQVDEVVVSASRNETNKLTSPTIVNVASKKLFETTSSCNLAESMNFQSGLRVENNCGNCGTTQLRINGLEGQYSQVLLDSRPIFSSLAAVYGLEQLPVSMIERVEVVRGGGSALFGSNAIGGVVNIITKEPLRNSMMLSNTTNILKGGAADINTSLNGSFVTDDYKAGAYLFGMIKHRDAYDRNNDGFSDLPMLNSETIGFRGYYKTSNYSKLTAEYHHIHEFRRGGDNLGEAPHMADIAEQLNHKIDGGGLKFDYFSPDYKHKVGVYTSAQLIKRDSYFGVDKNPDAYGNTNDKTFVAGSQYTYSFDKCLFMPADLTAGIEYNFNKLHDLILGYGRDFTQTTHIAGLYFQNEWKSEKFNFLLGGRLDKHNLMKNAVFSPRVNVRYSPTKKIGLRASYSSGYRAPQAYNEDLHIDAVSGSIALIQIDPLLKPEYSHSWSASADLYHNFGAVQANLLVEGFYTVLNDVFTLEKIGESADGNIIMERRNASGASVKGISTEVKLGIPNKFEVQLGYTFQKSMYKEAEQWSDELTPQKRMFRSPDHYGYMTANYNITKALRASVFGNYTGSMLVQHNKGFIEHDTEKITPNYWDMGVKLAYNIKVSKLFNIEVNGGVKNIFDSYQGDLDFGMNKDAAYIYGPSLPRTVFVGLKMEL
ncbi:MAG: TonB-dependent receptor [Bacteroidales bacterium]